MRLNEAIKAVMPHAQGRGVRFGADILRGVLVGADGYVYATDRFTLARARIDESATPGVDVFIPSDIAADVIAVGDGTLTLSNGATMPVPTAPGEYPAVRRLFGDDAAGADAVVLDIKHLSRFTKSVYPMRGRVGLRFEFNGTSKPVRVTVDGLGADEFTGLICTIRPAA